MSTTAQRFTILPKEKKTETVIKPHRNSRLDTIFILAGGGGLKDYVPSGNVETEITLKIVGRRVSEGSTTYTDCFKAYADLRGAEYMHISVNHSASEWVRVNTTLTTMRMRHR